ncbi:hypothetical protein [Maribacter sp. 2304DJ31-5]|uniref:hypothetical protein n=1 Tax=Maribacter sp. 2304DJ31-5 TaxID=3386273 RepID=UPI0039BC82DC
MKTLFSLLYIVLTLLFYSSCSKNEPCKNQRNAKLFYLDNCATINGYIILEQSNEVYTFQDELEEKFKKDEINVKLSFEFTSPRILTADCFQNEVVKITCIQEN